jgi:hypothetical protein
MEKSLEGSLVQFEVPDILMFLKAARRTGVLVLERPGREAKVFCRHGDPVFATSNRPDLGLAFSVSRATEKPVADLDGMLVRGRRRRLPEGQVLVEEGVMTDGALVGHLQTLMREALFDTLDWREGSFAFFDGIEPPTAAAALPRDLHALVMEGERRVDERARLAEVFPDHELIVEGRVITEAEDKASTLTPDEWKVYRLADGRRSLAEICRCNASAPEADTLEVLRRLLLSGYVALRQPVPPAPEEAPSRVAPSALGATRLLEVREPNGQGGGAPRLVVVSGGHEVCYPIAKRELVLGRHRNCDLVLADAKVSSSHARVEYSDGAIVLVDLDSRNGSYVNGHRVSRATLEPGDEIQVGTTRIVLRVDGDVRLS